MAKSLNLNQLTLRDKIHEAIRRTHDLTDHLDQAFVPKVRDLRKLTKLPDPGSDAPPIADVTIRHHAALILESDQYTEGLDSEGQQLFESIASDVERLTSQHILR